MKKTNKIYLWMAIMILMSFPLVSGAAFWDDWFDDFEDYFSKENSRQVSSSSVNNNNVQVSNSVSAEATTGGNTISGQGEIIQGKSEVKVEIKTIINGQSIDPVSEHIIKEDGSDASIKVEQKIIVPAEGGEPEVEREIEYDYDNDDDNNAATQKENLSQQGTEEQNIVKNNFSAIGEWWEGIFQNLKSFFKNIFKIF